MRADTGKGSPPECPFCGAALNRPAEVIISAMEKVQGGTCACGAIFLVDPTGKNVGMVMAQALGIISDSLNKKISDLAAGQDYEDAVLSYDWRTHRALGRGGFPDGMGRLYIIQAKKGGRS